uniref:Uncharacterized protein n=1 Tax=Timema douglasi TaxID=61478 RepID=A0A7R8Z9M7_TIMDO|nr:unnamed protein product [Timema douglasi]
MRMRYVRWLKTGDGKIARPAIGKKHSVASEAPLPLSTPRTSPVPSQPLWSCDLLGLEKRFPLSSRLLPQEIAMVEGLMGRETERRVGRRPVTSSPHAVPRPQDDLSSLLHVLHCGGRRHQVHHLEALPEPQADWLWCAGHCLVSPRIRLDRGW